MHADDIDAGGLCDDCQACEPTTHREYIHGTKSDAGTIFDAPELEPESLRDCLQEVGAGLSARPWY
jgi:hypothetical protein